jgi:hypothetical protein
MQVTACTSFSIAISTEGTPTAATEIDFFCGSMLSKKGSQGGAVRTSEEKIP